MKGEWLQICQDAKMPAKSSGFLWLQQHEDFLHQYQAAKHAQLDGYY